MLTFKKLLTFEQGTIEGYPFFFFFRQKACLYFISKILLNLMIDIARKLNSLRFMYQKYFSGY